MKNRNFGGDVRAIKLKYYAPLLSLALCALHGCAAAGSYGNRATAVSSVPQPGATMPMGASSTGLIHSGRRLCAYSTEVSDVKYDFDVRCGETVVVYVQTRDGDFRTPEGISTGHSLRDALTATGSSLEEIGGECGVLLSSGWIARPEPELRTEAACDALLEESIVYFDTRPFDG